MLRRGSHGGGPRVGRRSDATRNQGAEQDGRTLLLVSARTPVRARVRARTCAPGARDGRRLARVEPARLTRAARQPDALARGLRGSACPVRTRGRTARCRMKSFRTVVIAKHPVPRLWATVRDQLSDLTPMLDDVERVTVVS